MIILKSEETSFFKRYYNLRNTHYLGRNINYQKDYSLVIILNFLSRKLQQTLANFPKSSFYIHFSSCLLLLFCKRFFCKIIYSSRDFSFSFISFRTSSSFFFNIHPLILVCLFPRITMEFVWNNLQKNMNQYTSTHLWFAACQEKYVTMT
jgi:hypothetical protein